MKNPMRIRLFAAAVALAISSTAFAGTDGLDNKPVEKVYSIAMVDQKPEFPGGEQEMYKWLSEHMEYPAEAQEEGVQGRVVVAFFINPDGAVENVRVARGRHPALDREAVRLIKSMPRWTPGIVDCLPVTVSYSLPITFKLPNQ